MSHFLGDDDDDFVLAGVEAYNNFLFEEFCAPDPTRLIGLAQIPSIGIDVAVDALRKAQGARCARASSSRTGRREANGISAADDPFWAAAVDEGMPGVGAHQHHQPCPARRGAARRRRARATRATT